MTAMDLFGYSVEIDKERTKKLYERTCEDSCDCCYCRNFSKVLEQGLLPAPITEVLKQLDLAPEDTDEVCEICEVDNRPFYEFSYLLIGQVFNPDERREREDGPLMIGYKKFPWGGVSCSSGLEYSGDRDISEPHFRMVFTVTLPWVLDEPVPWEDNGF